MARIAKPTAVKELTGNPGKRPVNYREPKPVNAPVAPSMSKSAKAIWTKLVGAMPAGVFTAVDSYVLAAYCEAVARHAYAVAKLEKGPKEVEGSTGQLKLSPWFAEVSDSARLIATLGAKLGLDPVSRQHINTDVTTGQATKFDGLIS